MRDPDFSSGADLILCNARVITLDAERPSAAIVAIRGSRILATGSQDDLFYYQRPGTRVIDCQGGTVIPGFNDAHCHPLSLAVNLLSLDCSPGRVSDIRGIQELVRRAAERTPPGKWIRAVNYDEFYIREQRPPYCWELDQACSTNPVILIHRTAGKCVLNSLALQLCQPAGDSVHRNPASGQPDGLIIGRNAQVEKALPVPDAGELERGMHLVNLKYLSEGITSLQDTTWNNSWGHWHIWQKLIDREIVSQRVSLFLGTSSLDASAAMSFATGSSRLQVAGIKLALDESTGNPHPPQPDINHMALRACQAGFNVAFHVSDVPALESSLAAIYFVRQVIPGTDCRFRLEHCTVCPPDLLLRIQNAQASVTAQPAFLYYFGQKYLDELPSYRTNWFQPFRSFRRWNVKVAFSSDAPLVDSSPLAGIYAAVTRKTEKGCRLAPQESLSLAEALQMYTLGGAEISFQDQDKGSISPGKFADLVVFNGDISRTAPEQLLDLKVVLCIINGQVAWETSSTL